MEDKKYRVAYLCDAVIAAESEAEAQRKLVDHLSRPSGEIDLAFGGRFISEKDAWALFCKLDGLSSEDAQKILDHIDAKQRPAAQAVECGYASVKNVRMFGSLEKIIRDYHGMLHIEEERYGPGLLAGVDIGIYQYINNATKDMDATLVYEGTEVADAIDAATSPGDWDALTALSKLVDYAADHPAFLFVKADNLAEVFSALEARAAKWNLLSQAQQEDLMLGFIAFEGSPI